MLNSHADHHSATAAGKVWLCRKEAEKVDGSCGDSTEKAKYMMTMAHSNLAVFFDGVRTRKAKKGEGRLPSVKSVF